MCEKERLLKNRAKGKGGKFVTEEETNISSMRKCPGFLLVARTCGLLRAAGEVRYRRVKAAVRPLLYKRELGKCSLVPEDKFEKRCGRVMAREKI